MKHYDYMIVGAGPAGCFAAAMLAERGWKVIVLERREKGFCKLCGDGISVQAVHVLRQAGFPAERLEAAGAVRIKTVCHKRGDTLSRMTLGDEQRAYALSRRTTDALFRAYCEEKGAEIVYGEDVRELSRNGAFRYRDRESDHLIIATGVASNLCLDGKRLLRFCSRPVGVSAIVRGKRAENGYYLFDWRSACRGTYAWIFTLGEDRYNVGIWLKEDKRHIRALFDDFMNETVPQWCGSVRVETPLRGAYMGIGAPVSACCDGVYVIGDAANTSRSDDGEGISKAVISAAELVSGIGRRTADVGGLP